MAMRRRFSKIFNNRWVYLRKAIIYQANRKEIKLNLKLSNSFELIFPAKIEDIPDLQELSKISRNWPKQFCDRGTNSDYHLLLFKENNRLAYFAWVSFKNEEDKYIRFNSHNFSQEPYLFNCYTISDFRGLGLHTAATSYIINYYLKQNELIWGIIYSNNKQAIKSWKRAGMSEQATIYSFGFFALKRSVIRKP